MHNYASQQDWNSITVAPHSPSEVECPSAKFVSKVLVMTSGQADQGPACWLCWLIELPVLRVIA
jgi:hypothetical protein